MIKKTIRAYNDGYINFSEVLQIILLYVGLNAKRKQISTKQYFKVYYYEQKIYRY
jgi:hypothetical protein